MQNRHLFVVSLLAITSALSCCHSAPRETPPSITQPADTLTVTRLNPDFADAPADAARPNLHDVEVLATRSVVDVTQVRQLRQRLADPATYDGPPYHRCFLPRLDVRDPASATEYVICAQCVRIDVYHGTAPVESRALSLDACDAFERLAAEIFPEFPAASAGEQAK